MIEPSAWAIDVGSQLWWTYLEISIDCHALDLGFSALTIEVMNLYRTVSDNLTKSPYAVYLT